METRKKMDYINKKDIIAIIEACRYANVTKFKAGDIEIDFQANGMPMIPPPPPMPVSGATYKDDTMELVDETLAEEARITRLQIEDPEGYEQYEIDRQLRG